MRTSVGRPPIWTDPEQLQGLIDEYFEIAEHPTLAGLAYEIGVDRQTLYNYQEKNEFFGIVKAARERVEAIYEERLLYSSQPTGVIFALKNMSWRDKSESDITSGGKPIPIYGGAATTTI